MSKLYARSNIFKYIDVQNFLRLPETWRTQQTWWRTFIRCVRDLSHPVIRGKIYTFFI